MIKKILGSLIIIGISITGFSNAATQQVGLNSKPSSLDNNYEITALEKGKVLTNYLGVGKGLFAFSSSRLLFRTNNSFPYLYLSNSIQGYFSKYSLCNYSISSNESMSTSSCTTYDLDNNTLPSLKNFFSTVSNGDYFYYYMSSTPYKFCRSSNSFGKAFCIQSNNLTGSEAYSGLTFSNISESLYINGPNIGTATGEIIINTGVKYNYTCPTIGQLMQNMGENYNTGLCYNNTTYFNGTEFEQVEKQDIFTIFNDDYQEYINRISIYRNNCRAPATNQACQNAFSGEYKKFSIISNAINSNVDEKKLRNYCNMGLNYDPNTTTCVASGGGIKEPYTTEEIIKDITDNGIIVTPKTTGENQNNVTNALNKCENGDRECYINDRNFIESMGNIYGKITGLFKERNGVNGIIPNYILRITFITILFTVIFKK